MVEDLINLALQKGVLDPRNLLYQFFDPAFGSIFYWINLIIVLLSIFFVKLLYYQKFYYQKSYKLYLIKMLLVLNHFNLTAFILSFLILKITSGLIYLKLQITGLKYQPSYLNSIYKNTPEILIIRNYLKYKYKL